MPSAGNWRELAERELRLSKEAYRRRLRGNFAAYCDHILPIRVPRARKPAKHQRLLIDTLSWAAMTPRARVMISMPPGSAKSTYASQLFPAWYMARGGTRVIGSSHNDELAEKFSRDVQGVVRDDGATLGYGLANEAIGEWNTTNGSSYLAAGVMVRIAGRRGDLAVIDDPIGSAKDADSESRRKDIWNWYTGDLRPRLTPDAKIVLVMTRWHEDDLAGRLLQYEPDEWRQLVLPALAESDDPLGREIGEPLWSDDDYGYGAQLPITRDKLIAEGKARQWYSLYQQRPTADKGGFFNPDMIGVVDQAPLATRGSDVRAWDLAATAAGGDATAGVRLRRYDAGGITRYCVIDVRDKRGSPEQIEKLVADTAAEDGKLVTIRLPQDPGQAGKHQVQYYVSRLAGYRVIALPPSGSKETRAAPMASLVNAGIVSMMRAPWNAAFCAELAAFPSGRHDDKVDALSDAGNHFINPARPARKLQYNYMGR